MIDMYGKCEICERWANLHRHHVFMGNKQRNLSEQYGAVMFLCPECHTEGKASVHKNKVIRLWTQEEMQKKLMDAKPAEQDLFDYYDELLEGLYENEDCADESDEDETALPPIKPDSSFTRHSKN